MARLLLGPKTPHNTHTLNKYLMEILGKFLIAPPAVKASFWHKTVIMITEHHSGGSLGLVLNKPSDLTIEDFGHQLDMVLDVPGKVYIGGPINKNSLSMLHSNEWSCKNTLMINDKFSLSSADDVLPRLGAGDRPKQWRLFLGMCGWGQGQLMSEIEGRAPWKHEHSWCIAEPDTELVFETDGINQWANSLDKSALDFAQSILA